MRPMRSENTRRATPKRSRAPRLEVTVCRRQRALTRAVARGRCVVLEREVPAMRSRHDRGEPRVSARAGVEAVSGADPRTAAAEPHGGPAARGHRDRRPAGAHVEPCPADARRQLQAHAAQHCPHSSAAVRTREAEAPGAGAAARDGAPDGHTGVVVRHGGVQRDRLGRTAERQRLRAAGWNSRRACHGARHHDIRGKGAGRGGEQGDRERGTEGESRGHAARYHRFAHRARRFYPARWMGSLSLILAQAGSGSGGFGGGGGGGGGGFGGGSSGSGEGDPIVAVLVFGLFGVFLLYLAIHIDALPAQAAGARPARCGQPPRRPPRTTPTSPRTSSSGTRSRCSARRRWRGTRATARRSPGSWDRTCSWSGSAGSTTSTRRAGTTAWRWSGTRPCCTWASPTARTTTRTARWSGSRPS